MSLNLRIGRAILVAGQQRQASRDPHAPVSAIFEAFFLYELRMWRSIITRRLVISVPRADLVLGLYANVNRPADLDRNSQSIAIFSRPLKQLARPRTAIFPTLR
jgi:hypothetical protein